MCEKTLKNKLLLYLTKGNGTDLSFLFFFYYVSIENKLFVVCVFRFLRKIWFLNDDDKENPIKCYFDCVFG